MQITTTIEQNGILVLQGLPFSSGEKVEVFITAHASVQADSNRYPLRGTPYRYDDPTEPLGEEEWEAAQ